VQTTTNVSSPSRADSLRAAPPVEVEGVFDNFDKVDNSEKDKDGDGDGNGATLASRVFAPFGFLVCLASFTFVFALAMLALYCSVRRADINLA
jgi:hypothetical protein